MKSQSTLTGAAGEHYVMYRLLKMGYIAALAPKGVPNADLIVTDVEGQLTAVIQVKTKSMRKANDGWQMKEKHENLTSDHLFYCFVDDTGVSPVTYVVPSKLVAELTKEAHAIWLSIPGKKTQAHQDNSIRWFLPDYKKVLKVDNNFTRKYSEGFLDEYKENWGILRLN